MEEIFKNVRCLLISSALLFIVFGILPATAQAASLYFSPSSGSYAVGKTFNVNVYVSSADQAMNAASGVISFPRDKLEITSLSKSGSIFSLWVLEPSFSNSAGVINFEGIVLNPGFSGAAGKVLTANFKVKTAGTARLNFSSGSALANDGKGTNILASLGSAQFSLGGAVPTVPEVTEEKLAPAPISGAPSAPQVSSATHPESNKWYSNKNPQFSWALPANVNGVSVYFSQSPTSNPGPVSNGLFAAKSYENIEDGVWYFHIKMRNSAGWGPITHFKIQIDTTPPEPFEIRFVDGNETDNPRPTIIVDHEDSLSGIAGHCDVKVDNGEWFVSNYEDKIERPNQPHIFPLPPPGPGRHTIVVKAFDKAGNDRIATAEFTIKPLETPVITEYPKVLASGEILVIKGISRYLRSLVTMWFQGEKGELKSQSVKADEKGNFTFIADERLKDGIYNFWAEVVDERQAKSLPTEKLTMAVKRPAFLRVGSSAIALLSVAVPLAALVILLLFILWFGWHKFVLFRNRLRKEVQEAEQTLHRAFDLLKKDIRNQIKLLNKTQNKRPLTKEEEKIFQQLKKDLDDSEGLIGKEIKDIKKAVK